MVGSALRRFDLLAARGSAELGHGALPRLRWPLYSVGPERFLLEVDRREGDGGRADKAAAGGVAVA